MGYEEKKRKEEKERKEKENGRGMTIGRETKRNAC